MPHRKTQTRTRRRIADRALTEPCPQQPGPFKNDDHLLETAAQLFHLRLALSEAAPGGSKEDDQRRRLAKQEADWSCYWHASFRLTGDELTLSQLCRRHRLNRIEREILVALVLSELAMLPGRIGDCSELLDLTAHRDRRSLRVIRLLSEQGRLARSKLVGFDDLDETLPARRPLVDPAILDGILAKGGNADSGWTVSAEEDIYGYLPPLTRALKQNSEMVEQQFRHFCGAADVFKWSRKAERLRTRLESTLARHPEWKLSQVYREVHLPPAHTIFLALLGKHLGHLPPEDELFLGGGLARAATECEENAACVVNFLTPRGELVTKGLIRPSGGENELATDNSAELERTEFELTEKAIEALGLGKRVLKSRTGEYCARRPNVHLDQLVLDDQVRRALDLALVDARHGRRLMDEWGLGKIVPYGRRPVLLFSGPPGTGKTATAEAFAHALDKSILVADYSCIQNCYIGNTEKNIVRAFREAKLQDAVLFWDEADAMFFDRDAAHRNWEVRDVNILLQELERFDGFCILATNRKLSLDKALERRITLKVDFPRPDRQQRLRIWKQLLPRTMPLARDIDLEELSQAELVGAEVKNVVLNAGRLALQRDERGPVTMSDFHAALAMEHDGRWNTDHRSPIGFRQ